MSSLNFGPDWLRALSGGKEDNPPPSPPYSIQPVKYKLAEHRYGREEMLGLYTPAESTPPDLEAFPDLLRERHGQPLAFIAPSEEEERCQMGGVNSSLVLKLAGRGVPGRGRGGMRQGGRGRGRGDVAPVYTRSVSADDGLQGRGDPNSRRPWVDPSQRNNNYDKGRTDLQAGLTHEQRSRLSSDGRPPGSWRSPNGQEDDGGGEWRVSGSKSWRRSENNKSWREPSDDDSIRNRSWNRSDHDRNASDNWKQQSSSLPEWCDNGEDESPGTFDESGQFQSSSSHVKTEELEVPDSHPSRDNHTALESSKEDDDAGIDAAKPHVKESPIGNDHAAPAGFNGSDANQSSDSHTATNTRDSGTSADSVQVVSKDGPTSHIVNETLSDDPATRKGKTAAAVDSEEMGLMDYGHVKSLLDGLDSEEDDICDADDPSILYAKKAPAGDAPGRGIEDWLYKDPRGEIQGPFSSDEMLEWFRAGYFTVGLLVRRVCDEMFMPLGDVVKLWNRIPFTSGATLAPITQAQVIAQQQAQQRQQETYQRTLQEQQLLHQVQQQQQQQKQLQIEQQQRMKEQRQYQQRLLEQQQQHRLLEQQRRQQQEQQQLLVEHQKQLQQEQQMLQLHEKRMKELDAQKQQLLMRQMQDKRHIEQTLLRELKIGSVSPQSDLPMVHGSSPTPMMSQAMGDTRASTAWAGDKPTSFSPVGDDDTTLRSAHLTPNQQSNRQDADGTVTARRMTPSPSGLHEDADDEGFQSQMNRRQKKMMRNAALERETAQVNADNQRQPVVVNDDAHSKAEEELQQKHHAMLQRHQQMQQLEHQRHMQAMQQQQQQQMRSKMLSSGQGHADAAAASWQKSPPMAPGTPSLLEIQRIEEERQRELKRREKMRLIQQQQQMQDQKNMAGWRPTAAPGSASSIVQIQQEEARRQQMQRGLIHQQEQPHQQPSPPKSKGMSSSPWNAPVATHQTTPVNHHSNATASDAYKASASFWDDVMTSAPQANPVHPASVQTSAVGRSGDAGQRKASKKTKDEATVQRLFQDQNSNDFAKWVEAKLPSLSDAVEVQTFVAFLKDIESTHEVEDYVRSYLGNSEAAQRFLNEFLRRRNEKGTEIDKGSSDRSDFKGEGDAEEGTAQGKRTKKKKKMQRVDPYLLGFSCNSGADIVNRAGEIMKAEDAWNVKR